MAAVVALGALAAGAGVAYGQEAAAARRAASSRPS